MNQARKLTCWGLRPVRHATAGLRRFNISLNQEFPGSSYGHRRQGVFRSRGETGKAKMHISELLNKLSEAQVMNKSIIVRR